MRRQGKVAKWNAERGFGFLRETDGRVDVFAHVSAFPRTGRTPTVGDAVSFEIETGTDGRSRARAIAYDAPPGTAGLSLVPIAPRRAAHSPVHPAHAPIPGRTRGPRASGGAWRWLVLAGAVAAGAWLWRHGPPDLSFVAQALAPGTRRSADGSPPGNERGSGQGIGPLRPDDSPIYTCDGRQHCSQMRSCDEARWMLANCSGMAMDGDGDGHPCEDMCGQ